MISWFETKAKKKFNVNNNKKIFSKNGIRTMGYLLFLFFFLSLMYPSSCFLCLSAFYDLALFPHSLLNLLHYLVFLSFLITTSDIKSKQNNKRSIMGNSNGIISKNKTEIKGPEKNRNSKHNHGCKWQKGSFKTLEDKNTCFIVLVFVVISLILFCFGTCYLKLWMQNIIAECLIMRGWWQPVPTEAA